MPISRLLIANRGEIAIRIARAAADLGIETIAVYSDDDTLSLHHRLADHAMPLAESGVKAYLNSERIVEIAKETGCDALHPGYGFLAENGLFARQCGAAGLTFVGPNPELLDLFGDKGQARRAAIEASIPLLKGTDTATSLEEAERFMASLAGRSMMIKAIAGGGGRGSRIVGESDNIADVYERCRSEAQAAFGNPDVYVEEYMVNARHIEVQILGDRARNVTHLGERDCSIQRRLQKIVEIAPAPNLQPRLRDQICDAALRFAQEVGYDNAGTFEFLVDENAQSKPFVFLETNARLQVEHTVTEEVTGIDLVQAQLRIAAGETLSAMGIESHGENRMLGYAVQVRVNMETITADGDVRPSGGTLTTYQTPGGPGTRTDGFGYINYTTNPNYDSLLAKVICHSRSDQFSDAVQKTYRALSEFQIEGVATNIAFLQNLLMHPDLIEGNTHTGWLDTKTSELAPKGADDHQQRFHSVPGSSSQAPGGSSQASNGLAGAKVDGNDPLALFAHDQAVKSRQTVNETDAAATMNLQDGSRGLAAPIQGTIVSIQVAEGDEVHQGQTLVIMEAMKMEHEIAAAFDGIVTRIGIATGDVIQEGHPLIYILEAEIEDRGDHQEEAIDLDEIRADLQESIDRHAHGLDENRPKAVARRRKTGQRTARENIMDLCDPGTFKEYGPLVLAAQRRRRTLEWLRENTPGDGVVGGIGAVNSHLFADEKARVVALSYDYTVFAGTQGHKNHYKQDRLFELANRFRLPVIFYTEGGGGRPGDTDGGGGIGMDVYTFTQWSKLSGLVPLIGINSGRCFAGNTALLGVCDIIIATENSTIAMGGPAMIEGGGLGIYTPEEVGPMSFQVPNGVVDILVKDEAEATRTAQKYISYFQGDIKEWDAPDQRVMRHIVPENRLRMYDVRDVINTLADKDSVLEIRRAYGIGIITALVRVEGKPLGLIANNPHHLAGAIDSDAADKAARFLQLCDAFDLPVISVMDCPGIMVGPEVEKTALVRHCCRLFSTGANLTVPLFGLIIRKAYGLGVQAMCGGSSMVPFFTVCWPTAEFAGMNLEGAIKLGYRNDLAAIDDPEERLQKYNEMVAASYEGAKAVNSASHFGVDDVIDPAESRDWIARGLKSLPPVPPREGKKRPNIDTW